jgi:Flp pilus assembly protein TadG
VRHGPSLPKRAVPTPQGGQILVVFAGGIVLLFLIAGLVIDGGTAFLNRRDGQNSADVAAMAGTKRLADYHRGLAPPDILSTIAGSIARNGCQSLCSWTASYVGPRRGSTFVDLGLVGGGAPPANALGVRVNVTRRPHTYFLGVVGQTSWKVDTTATAVSGDPTGAPASQLLPIAVLRPPDLKTGMIYALTNGKDAPGNFGWLSWSGGGGSLTASICTPNNGAFGFPTEVPGDQGGAPGSPSVRNCLQQWVDSRQPILIPIADEVIGEGSSTRYRIQTIAVFTITSFSQPAVDQINGRFEGTLPYSKGATAPGGNAAVPDADSPFYYIGLVQ